MRHSSRALGLAIAAASGVLLVSCLELAQEIVRTPPAGSLDDGVAGRLLGGLNRAVVKPGRIMFEMAGVSPELAKEAMRLAGHKLPVRTKFVTREET